LRNHLVKEGITEHLHIQAFFSFHVRTLIAKNV
jgi:hypothetical protein